MLINFVDATNNANHYTKPPQYTHLLRASDTSVLMTLSVL